MARIPFDFYLLQEGIITREQLLQVLDHFRNTTRSLGEYFVSRGVITPDQLEELRREVPRVSGLDFGGVKSVLTARTYLHTAKQFAMAMLERGYVTLDQLSDLLDSFRRDGEESLVACKVLTREQLEQHRAAYDKLPAPPPPLEAPAGIEHHKGGRESLYLLDSAANLLFELGIDLQRRPLDVNATALPAAEMEAAIDFSGALDGTVSARTSRAVLRTLAARMTGSEAPTDPEALADALREFLNVVAGDACGRLSDEAIEADFKSPRHKYDVARAEVPASIAQTVQLPGGDLTIAYTPRR